MGSYCTSSTDTQSGRTDACVTSERAVDLEECQGGERGREQTPFVEGEKKEASNSGPAFSFVSSMVRYPAATLQRERYVFTSKCRLSSRILKCLLLR